MLRVLRLAGLLYFAGASESGSAMPAAHHKAAFGRRQGHHATLVDAADAANAAVAQPGAPGALLHLPVCTAIYLAHPGAIIGLTWGSMSPRLQQRWQQLGCDAHRGELEAARRRGAREHNGCADGAAGATSSGSGGETSAAADAAAAGGRTGERVLRTLRTGTISRMEETAGKTTKCLFKVVIGVGAGAVPAMLRLEEHFEARGEMLAYDVDRWFGFDRAPATVWRCFDLRRPGQSGATFRDKIAAHCPDVKSDVACGAVQHKLGGLRGDETGKSCGALGEALCPACSTLPREEVVHAQQEVALLAAFDFLIGNLDRAVFHGRMLYMCRQRQERCEDFQALRAGIAVPRSKRASVSGLGQARAFINQLLREVKNGNHGNLFPKINNVFCVNEPAGNRLRVQFVDNGRNLLADAARGVRPNKLWASGEAPSLGAASPAGMCCNVAASSPFRKQLQRFTRLSAEEQHAALGWTRARKCDRRWKWSSAQEELVNFAVRRAQELEKCMRSCPGRGEQSDWQRPFLARMTADRLGRKVAEGSRRYHGCKHTAFSGSCRDGVLMGNGKLQNVRNYQACAALCRKSAGCVAFSHYQYFEGCLLWSGSCSHERLGPVLAAAVVDQPVEDDPVTCWISGAATDDTKPARISQSEHFKVNAAFWHKMSHGVSWDS